MSTTNLNLSTLAGSEKLKTFPSPYNDNMTAIDGAFGAGFGVGTNNSVNQAINALADGIAIIANGNSHAAITAGQYVYVRNHGSLSEGLYVASANISTNGTLSGSNLNADASGGLNSLNSKINALIPQKVVDTESSTTKTITLGNNSRAVIDYLSNNTTSNFSISVMTNTQGNVNILEKGKGSAVTFDTSTANKIIVNIGNTARTGYFLIQAPTKTVLDAITVV